MIKIRLTGGKSTVSKELSKHFTIIDCDIIARKVLDIYPQILIDIRKQFGNEYFDNDGNLIRKKIGNYIFSHPDKKQYRRKYVLQKYGWKLIRIISYKDKLYSNEQLLNLIDEAKQYLLNTKHT